MSDIPTDPSDPRWNDPVRPTPTPQRPNRNGWWLVVLLIGIGLVVWAVTQDDDDEPTVSGDVRTAAEVTYHVGGTARSVDITIETPTGTSQQSVDVPLMNRGGGRGLTFTFPPGAFVYISAQNRAATGTVRCEIEVDGITIAENTSSGAYSIAQCDGSA